MTPGDVVNGRFEIDRRAGAGGMGTVFRAIDRQTGRPVAVKVLLSSSPNLAERFSREAAVLADLRHPGIVGFVESGTTPDGQAYLVMDWLEGESLGNRLTRETLSVPETVELGRRVGEALSVAHARGVVHRDLKPSNLFLVGGDVAKVTILDFGIAKVAESGQSLTRTGQTLGSPGFTSPEQARGEKDLDARADVFSLACVLYKCLTGEVPFTGDLLEVILKVVTQPAPRASARRADVPPALEDLMQRMFSKKREGRPEDGGAVARELASVLPRPSVVPASMPPPSLAPVSAKGTVLMAESPGVPSARTMPMVVAGASMSVAPPPLQKPARSKGRVLLVVAGVGLVLAAGAVAAGVLAFPQLTGATEGRHAKAAVTAVTAQSAAPQVGAPCAGALRCMPYKASDARVDAMDVLPSAIELAQAVEKGAALCEMMLGGTVEGFVPVGTVGEPGLVMRFGTKGSRGLDVALWPGQLAAAEGGPCPHALPPPACTPRMVARAAEATGVPPGVPASMIYHHDETAGGPVWEYGVPGRPDSRRRFDGRTCAPKLKPR